MLQFRKVVVTIISEELIKHVGENESMQVSVIYAYFVYEIQHSYYKFKVKNYPTHLT